MRMNAVGGGWKRKRLDVTRKRLDATRKDASNKHMCIEPTHKREEEGEGRSVEGARGEPCTE